MLIRLFALAFLAAASLVAAVLVGSDHLDWTALWQGDGGAARAIGVFSCGGLLGLVVR